MIDKMIKCSVKEKKYNKSERKYGKKSW